MMKLAVILLLVGAAAASGIGISPLVTSQRATIPHYSPYNYLGNGISSRYQTKADYGYGAVGGVALGPGIGLGAGLYGPLSYGNGLILNNGYAGLGFGGIAYNGLGLGGIAYNGLGLGGIAYNGLGLNGLNYRSGLVLNPGLTQG